MNRRRDEEAGENTGGRLGSFYAYKDTFNEDNVWVEVPKNGGSSIPFTAGKQDMC
jgi:hypothetical protein